MLKAANYTVVLSDAKVSTLETVTATKARC
jgi:hypothetical protein